MQFDIIIISSIDRLGRSHIKPDNAGRSQTKLDYYPVGSRSHNIKQIS